MLLAMTDKKRNKKILSIFIALSLLMGVVCNMTIPVCAAPSVDASVSTFNSFYYYTGQNTYTMSDAAASYEIKIPLYCLYYNSVSDGSYLNGYIRTSLPGYSFSFNGSSIAPSYFEVNSAPGLSCSSPTANSNSMTVYFDNHLKQDNVYFILGYFVFNFSEYTSLSISISPGAGLVSRDPTVSYMYQSTSEFGLAQAIVNGLAASQDIDIILNGLQDISENTDLLNDVIDGLSDNYTLLNQIYNRLGNIDDIIDIISWIDAPYSLSWSNSLDNNFINTGVRYSDPYFLLNITNSITPSNNYLFEINLPVYSPRSNTDIYNLKFEFYNYTKQKINIDYYYLVTGNSIKLYLNYFSSAYGSSWRQLYINAIGSEFNIGYTSSSFRYINSNDIEFYDIYYYTQFKKLYDLIESYINADVSAPVDQAANQAGNLASNEAAAEASLAALSPANLGDFDNAVSEITILDDVSQSLVFWTTAVNGFSTRSGSLWGIFIFGLLIGLIAFILRLRR